jgi:flagellin
MINPSRPSPSTTSVVRQGNDARSALQKTMERLTTGLRINRAADDAAGIAIAAQMTAELSGLFQASRNARDAMSVVQTAEGGLTEVGGMMDRMRTLAIQSASDVLGPQERSAIQQEVNQLQNEIGRTVDTTAFNGKKLLDGSLQNARFQVGPAAGQEISL